MTQTTKNIRWFLRVITTFLSTVAFVTAVFAEPPIGSGRLLEGLQGLGTSPLQAYTFYLHSQLGDNTWPYTFSKSSAQSYGNIQGVNADCYVTSQQTQQCMAFSAPPEISEASAYIEAYYNATATTQGGSGITTQKAFGIKYYVGETTTANDNGMAKIFCMTKDASGNEMFICNYTQSDATMSCYPNKDYVMFSGGGSAC